jgi:hypothetical protein
MAKYFFKYLQNYFQTESTIFMKAWDTMTLDFLGNCNGYESIFKEIKSLYIRDHELKFYILSVTKMSLQGGYKNIGLTKGDIITICKSILNRVILYDDSLYSKNYQSIFPFDSDLPNFLQYYNPKTYFEYYSIDRISNFERSLRNKLMTEEEMKREKQVSFPRKSQKRYSGGRENSLRNKYGKRHRDSYASYRRSSYHNVRSRIERERSRERREVRSRRSMEKVKYRRRSASSEKKRKRSSDSVRVKRKEERERERERSRYKDKEVKDPRRRRSSSSRKSSSSKSPEKRRDPRAYKPKRRTDYNERRSRSRARWNPKNMNYNTRKSSSSSSSSKSSLCKPNFNL